jgi:chromosome segregation ATPase
VLPIKNFRETLTASFHTMAPLGDPKGVAIVSNPSFDTNPEIFRARDEACDLRNQLCQLRCRLEEVEDERNFMAAKANEMKDAIDAYASDTIHEELVKKALRLAEMSMAMDSLQLELKKVKEENQKLQRARVNDYKKMEELSLVIHTIQCSDEDDSEDEEGETVLTPERALDKTLKNMKAQVEYLEDEHQTLSVKCHAQENTIRQLEQENDMKETRINMLEELFRNLNHKRHEEVPVVPKSDKASDSSDIRQDLRKAHSLSSLFVRRKRLENQEKQDDLPLMPRSRSLRSSGNQKQEAQPSKRKVLMIAVGDDVGEYAGPVVDGRPHGVGTVRFANGNTYLGEVKDGKLHGPGTLYSKDCVRRGHFEDNVFMG